MPNQPPPVGSPNHTTPHWHSDRRIPIALLVALGALIAQLIVGVYYFGILSERVNSNSTTIDRFQENYRNIPTQLAVLTALMGSVDLRLQQLSSGVEKHEDRFHSYGDDQ